MTPMMIALARAAKAKEGHKASNLRLDVLGVEIPAGEDRWAAHVEDTPPSGKRDALVRSSTGGHPELRIRVFLPGPGRCEGLVKERQSQWGKPMLARGRSYGSGPWYADARLRAQGSRRGGTALSMTGLKTEESLSRWDRSSAVPNADQVRRQSVKAGPMPRARIRHNLDRDVMPEVRIARAVHPAHT